MRLRGGIWRPVSGAGPLASTAVANAAIGLCGLLSGLLLARVLGAEGRGELAAIQAWPMLLVAVGNFGLTEAAAYFAASAPARARATLSSTLLLAIPFTALAVVAGFLILPRVLASQSVDVQQAARISLLLVPLMTLIAAPHQVLRGSGRYTAWNLLRLAMPVGWVAALAALELSGRADPANAAMAFVAMAAIAGAIAHAYAWRALPGPAEPSSELARPMLSYGAPTMVSAVPQWLNVRLDQLVMIAMLSPEALGLYAVAVAWGTATQPIATVLAYTAVPTLAAAGDAQQKARLVYRSGVIVSVCASALLLVATPVLFPLLFGEEFRSAIPAALIMVVAGALTGINAVGGECLRGLGRPRGALVAECAGLALTSVAVPVLIPLWGILGAAAASAVSYAAILLVQYRLISTTGEGRTTDPAMVLAVEAPPR